MQSNQPKPNPENVDGELPEPRVTDKLLQNPEGENIITDEKNIKKIESVTVSTAPIVANSPSHESNNSTATPADSLDEDEDGDDTCEDCADCEDCTECHEDHCCFPFCYCICCGWCDEMECCAGKQPEPPESDNNSPGMAPVTTTPEEVLTFPQNVIRNMQWLFRPTNSSSSIMTMSHSNSNNSTAHHHPPNSQPVSK